MVLSDYLRTSIILPLVLGRLFVRSLLLCLQLRDLFDHFVVLLCQLSKLHLSAAPLPRHLLQCGLCRLCSFQQLLLLASKTSIWVKSVTLVCHLLCSLFRIESAQAAQQSVTLPSDIFSPAAFDLR